MKYRRLTQEQLLELQQEFITFLATQSITGSEWETIKKEQPHVAEDEIDIFSDLVWERVLTKAQFLEHISPQTMNLFHLDTKEMNLISIMVGLQEIDITTKEGYKWLKENLLSEEVKVFTATKKYSADPQVDKFKLIENGAVITNGTLYQYFEDIVELGKDTSY